MSSRYDDDNRRRRPARDRSPEESTYRSTRDGGRQPSSLVRRNSSPSSVEEISRDFPPGDRGGYYRETTIRKKGRGPVREDRFDDRYDDKHSERDYGAANRSSRSYDGRGDYKRDDRRDDRSDRKSRRHYSSESSASRSPPRKDRRKSGIEETLGAVGLGGVAAALLGKKDRARSESRSRSRKGGRRDRSVSSDRKSTRSRGGDKKRSKSVGRDQVIQALKAAGLAAAGEAFRARKEPGGWDGNKGKRIMTAAISAAGVDGLISNNRDPGKHSKRDVIGSALAGLATNRIVNGPRSKSRGPGSPDGRGRSQSRGGLGDLAAGGVLAATGKKVYDRFRSRSRGRSRSRSLSSGSDSRSPPPKRRSQSVSGYAAKGLAALGLSDAANKVDPGRRKDSKRYDDDYYNDRGPPNAGYGQQQGGGYGYQDSSRDVSSRPRAGPNDMAMVGPNHYSLDNKPHHTGDPDTDSDSDLGSSSGEEKEIKRGKRRQYVTAGLATIATIHAAHSVYQAKEKRDANRKMLKEGEISPEQAKKSRQKQRWAEVGALGIAALGLKGAYSEWKETKETNSEFREKRAEMERHRIKRENRRRKYEDEARRYKESGYSGPMPSIGPGYGNGYAGSGTASPYGGQGGHGGHGGQGGPYSAHPAPTYYYDDNPYGSMSTPQYAPQDFPPPPGGRYAPNPADIPAPTVGGHYPPPQYQGQAYPQQPYPQQPYPQHPQ